MSEAMARTFLLNDLFVVTGHRRHGAGSLLLEAAVAHAKAEQAVRLSLTTNAANATAEKGHAMLNAAGTQLAALIEEIARLPLDTLRPDIDSAL